MAGRDVRDIMDLPKGEVLERAPKKKFEKKKSGHKRGLEKEIAGLQGDREAPIELNIGTQYKAKRKLEGPVRHWAYEPFVNGARNDGLVLHHLKRTNKPAVQARATTDKPADQVDDQENADPEATMEPVQSYAFEKYNIPTKYPQYDDAQYQKNLQSTEWSKDETDYLVGLYADFYGKWPIIWDRYEYQAPAAKASEDEPSTPPPPEQKVRSMEDLKGRFFEVARKVMTLHTPLTNMTTAEFEDHDKMTKWSAQHERDRKKIAEALLTRNKDEQREEDQLMLELQRIVRDQAKFDEEVRSLRERLDMSLTKDKPDAPLYTTYNQMGQLIQGYMQNDPRKLGRKSNLGSAVSSSPVTGSQSATASGTTKKSADKSGSSSNKKLPPQAQVRFGVSMHDRLTSGVTFRTDKIAKLRQAKSGVQTQKIANLLHELQIPELLQTPTVPVFQAMEKLIGQVTTLLDARRLREKEEGEIKIVMAQKQENEKPAADVSMTDAKSEKGGDTQASTGEEGDGDVDMTDAQEQSQNATQHDDADKDDANGKQEDDENADGENGEDEDAEGEDEDEEEATAHEDMDVDMDANENTEVQDGSEKDEDDEEEEEEEDQTFGADNDETNELQMEGDNDFDGDGGLEEAEDEGDDDDDDADGGADADADADEDGDGDGDADGDGDGDGEADDEDAAAEDAAEDDGDGEADADEQGNDMDASAVSTPGAPSATRSHHGIRGTSVVSATSSAGNGTIRVNPKRNKGLKT